MAVTEDKISGRWVKWLENEAESWVREGVIQEGQARAILLRYDPIKQKEEAESGSRLVTALAVLGALLLGIGVILFFASNWQYIPKPVKVAMIFSAIVVSYSLGYYLAFERGNYPRAGRALILLGTILYGSGIWLIAQIFHIDSHYPNGFLLWLLGIIPVVLVCGSVVVLIESALLLTVWTVVEQTGFVNYNLLFLPIAAVVMWLGYRLESRLAVGLTLPAVVVWTTITGAVSFYDANNPIPVFFLAAVAGLIIYVIGSLQNDIDRFAAMKTPYQIVGLLTFFLFLYLLSFKEVIEVFGQEWSDLTYPTFFMVLLGLTVFSTLAACWYWLNRTRERRAGEAAWAASLTIVLFVLTFAAPGLDMSVNYALMNLLLFISIVAVIVFGYRGREPILVNIGLLFFVLDVIARYVDFFWDMLPKSVFFMAGGLLLLVGGFFLERNRRKILQEMKVSSHGA